MYSVIEFGAICDKSINSTQAFQAAIDACKKNDGGVVYVPYGKYMIGTLYLCNNLHFVFEPGAEIFGSLDINDFAEREKIDYPLYQDPSHSYFNRSMFVAEKCKNITFSGLGTIDMQEVWEEKDIEGIYEWNARRAAKIFAFKECDDIVLKDMTLLHSTDLAVYLAGCRRVKITNMTLDVNIDGISPDACENVIISDCIIKSGDDGIVLKSSYTLNKIKDCENIVITNCTVASRCSAIKLGTETNGGFKNISISNCAIYNTFYGALSIESTDGGNVDGITVSNISMKNVGYPFFFILSNRGRGPENTTIGSMKNIIVDNVTAIGPYEPWTSSRITHLWEEAETTWESQVMPSTITGQPEKHIENISFSNIYITTKGGGKAEDKDIVLPEITNMYPENYQFGENFPTYGMYFRHVTNLNLNNIHIDTVEADERNAFVFDDVKNMNVNNIK